MTNIQVIREIYAKMRENWLTTQKKGLNAFNATATKRYIFHNQYIITKTSSNSRESFPVETKVLGYQVNLIWSTARLYIWTARLLQIQRCLKWELIYVLRAFIWYLYETCIFRIVAAENVFRSAWIFTARSVHNDFLEFFQSSLVENWIWVRMILKSLC